MLLPLALAVFACAPGSAAPAPVARPSANPSPAAPGIRVRSPVDVILTATEAGSGPGTGRDHIAITQAAEEQLNQAYALIQYREWGWVDEATRSFGNVDLALLLLTKEDGARLAFASFGRGLDHPCPPSLGADQCAEGASALAARVGPYVLNLTGPPADLERLATLQAAKLRTP